MTPQILFSGSSPWFADGQTADACPVLHLHLADAPV